MTEQYLQMFTQATGNILTQFGIDAAVSNNCVTPEKCLANHELVVIIGLTHSLRGSIVYGMTADTAKAIASTMMCGMPVPELDDMAKSAICEFANMSSGTSLANLPEDVVIDITPPTLVSGQQISVSSNQFDSLMSEVVTPLGQIEVRINIKS